MKGILKKMILKKIRDTEEYDRKRHREQVKST